MFQIISLFIKDVIIAGNTDTKLMIFSGNDDNLTNFLSVIFYK